MNFEAATAAVADAVEAAMFDTEVALKAGRGNSGRPRNGKGGSPGSSWAEGIGEELSFAGEARWGRVRRSRCWAGSR